MEYKEEYPALEKFKVPIDNAQKTNMLLNKILRLKSDKEQAKICSKKSIESQSTNNICTIWYHP